MEEQPPVGRKVTIDELEAYSREGREIVIASDIKNPKNPSLKLLSEGQILFGKDQFEGMRKRGIQDAEIVGETGALYVNLIPPPVQNFKPQFYQGTAEVKRPISKLIELAEQAPPNIAHKKEKLESIIGNGITVLGTNVFRYASKNEEAFFADYRKGDRNDYHEAIGVALIALAEGSCQDSLTDVKRFQENRQEIALGTFLVPIAKRKAQERMRRAPAKYAHQKLAHVAADLLREHGFSHTTSLIARCSDNGYTPEELTTKCIEVRLYLGAKKAYKALFESH